MKLPGFNDENDLVYKFVLKDNIKSESEYLPETAAWFRHKKIFPRIGDTVIPLETETAKKPFYTVRSIVWDTHKNEAVCVLERDLNNKVNELQILFKSET